MVADGKQIKIGLIIIGALMLLYGSPVTAQRNEGTITIRFTHSVQAAPLILDSGVYQNPFGEVYRVSKLKYYISNIKLKEYGKSLWLKNNYYLVDAADTASQQFSITVPAGKYESLEFMIGVDSMKNVSGAQSGALDPTKGMFWTWNSGYIFFKLEGNSTASTFVNQKIEYHIGGFAGAANALQAVNLAPPGNQTIIIHKNAVTTVYINTNVNALWKGSYDLKIATLPAMMTPGMVSKSIAENYKAMFSITNIAAD
ncbi:MAG: hypothetical protein JST86_04840 [Bacteroidetes bacterium]|nr:hypothetical protein [Bacteroidota bacterium]